MARSISMMIGGILLALGVIFLLVAWLGLRVDPLSDMQTTTNSVALFVAGLSLLVLGLLFVFVRSIARAQR